MSTHTDTRLFAVQRALEEGWGVDKVHDLTKIDKWFLSKLQNIASMRNACMECGDIDKVLATNGEDRMRSLKIAGFSDRQVRHILSELCNGTNSKRRFERLPRTQTFSRFKKEPLR